MHSKAKESKFPQKYLQAPFSRCTWSSHYCISRWIQTRVWRHASSSEDDTPDVTFYAAHVSNQGKLAIIMCQGQSNTNSVQLTLTVSGPGLIQTEQTEILLGLQSFLSGSVGFGQNKAAWDALQSRHKQAARVKGTEVKWKDGQQVQRQGSSNRGHIWGTNWRWGGDEEQLQRRAAGHSRSQVWRTEVYTEGIWWTGEEQPGQTNAGSKSQKPQKGTYQLWPQHSSLKKKTFIMGSVKYNNNCTHPEKMNISLFFFFFFLHLDWKQTEY